VVEPVSPEMHEKALAQVKKIIAERHHYSAEDKEALWIWDTLEGSKFTERIFGVMTLFFGAVIIRDAFVVVLCVLVVRSVLRPETDPVRADGVSGDDPDWPSGQAALTERDAERNRIPAEGVRSGAS